MKKMMKATHDVALSKDDESNEDTMHFLPCLQSLRVCSSFLWAEALAKVERLPAGSAVHDHLQSTVVGTFWSHHFISETSFIFGLIKSMQPSSWFGLWRCTSSRQLRLSLQVKGQIVISIWGLMFLTSFKCFDMGFCSLLGGLYSRILSFCLWFWDWFDLPLTKIVFWRWSALHMLYNCAVPVTPGGPPGVRAKSPARRDVTAEGEVRAWDGPDDLSN